MPLPRVARVLPVVRADFARPPLDGPEERAVLAERLAAGAVLLESDVLDVDGEDPARGRVVPSTVRTDGVWMWTDRLTYHVREHGLAPEQDLRRHLARAPRPVPDARLEEIRAAMACERPDVAEMAAARRNFMVAVYRGRTYFPSGFPSGHSEGRVRLPSEDLTDLALGFDPCNRLDADVRLQKDVPVEDLSELFRRQAWVVVRGVRLPVEGRRDDGTAYLYATREILHLLSGHDRIDAGTWTGTVSPQDAEDFFIEDGHFPVGPGWRDREPWSVRVAGA